MTETKHEKYLGDIFSEDGSTQKNIEARQAKGFGLVSEILSILKEVPFGKYRIQAGLKLQQSLFINSILTNSEVWYGVKDDQIRKLEQIDEHLIREVFGAHSKTATEMLYLETGTIPLRFIIKNRRVNYLHHILTRNENELIYKFFKAQERLPVKHDWVNSVRKDFEELKIDITHENISQMKKHKFKKMLKEILKIKIANESR